MVNIIHFRGIHEKCAIIIYMRKYWIIRKVFISLLISLFGDEMKLGVILIVLLLSVSIPVTAQTELPLLETIEMENCSDQYKADVVVPIYVLKGSTYELENRTIHIEIGPQEELTWYEGFIKVLITIVITDSNGKITADFKSYLNCDLENCDTSSQAAYLFWDHAGEERADKAGELFTDRMPLIVADDFCEVTIELVSFLPVWFLVSSFWREFKSDSQCILPLNGLTLEVEIDYSRIQKDLVESFQKASEYVTAGDAFFQEGELDEARSHYEKAKALYDQVNDEVQSSKMEEKILQIDYLKASFYVDEAEKYFSEEEYEKAEEEYEKAKIIYDQLSDTEQSYKIQERIALCMSYASAVETLEKGIKSFEEAQTKYGQRLDAFEETKLYFEKAKQEFDVLGDSQKSSECTTWMNRCDEEMSKLTTVGGVEVESPGFSWYGKLAIIVLIAGVLVVTIVLRWGFGEKVSEVPKRESDLEKLKQRLARGEITPEEYEKLLSNLENMRKLKYRLATGEITIDEYETLKSQLDS